MFYLFFSSASFSNLGRFLHIHVLMIRTQLKTQGEPFWALLLCSSLLWFLPCKFWCLHLPRSSNYLLNSKRWPTSVWGAPLCAAAWKFSYSNHRTQRFCFLLWEITVLHCLLSDIWKQLTSIFLFSFLSILGGRLILVPVTPSWMVAEVTA